MANEEARVTVELSEWWSATDIAARVAAGEASAREIVDCYLDRIARLDPELGAYLALDGERARQRALQLRRRIAATNARRCRIPEAVGDRAATGSNQSTAPGA